MASTSTGPNNTHTPSTGNVDIQDDAHRHAVETCLKLHTHRPDLVTLPCHNKERFHQLSNLNWPGVPFAIRSGGHSPNRGDASIDDAGVLLSLHRLNHITYDAGTKLASTGPGARWDEVYTELDKYNVTVVGGRVMSVGVGGLALGGGLSYLSDVHGLVCDNIVSYEVVLADGEVVEASETTHSDLFWALKGGGNNFGVVTRLVMQTFPAPQAWGGLRVFAIDQMAALMQALYEYQTAPRDPNANLIINLIPTNATLLLTLVYLKPVENPTAFNPFYQLTPVLDKTGFMSLHQLMALFPPATLPRWTWYDTSFRPNANLYAQISELLAPSTPEVSAIAARPSGTLVMAVQPIAASAVLAGRGRLGGNALGLEAVEQTWWSVSAAWASADDDDVVDGAVCALRDKIDDLAEREGVRLDCLFMNDANARQQVIASYGVKNVRRLCEVARRYDPHGVFQRLVPGGQKLPRSM
ncbi:FAD-binding domain-containing protein [Canariomyces notabilis]|uniref:FAD-binding domain-containing protein n=1 Tax=Canariomyces notabilis TaxID=2074819 RepID=A0AAN6QBC6_9PEZI|nr:FAD-binding domain-containing protein [Canariomyces arenarius]